MIVAALLFFALAAFLGVTMLGYLLMGKHIPKGLAILHGPLAVVGLVLLIIYSLHAMEGAWVPVGIFTVAAIGGVLLIHRDMTNKAPKWLGLVHGSVAVAGFLVLLVLLAFAYRHY
jgi:tetrahydromethanopterin S-methyltransferase subunit G